MILGIHVNSLKECVRRAWVCVVEKYEDDQESRGEPGECIQR